MQIALVQTTPDGEVEQISLPSNVIYHSTEFFKSLFSDPVLFFDFHILVKIKCLKVRAVD